MWFWASHLIKQWLDSLEQRYDDFIIFLNLFKPGQGYSLPFYLIYDKSVGAVTIGVDTLANVMASNQNKTANLLAWEVRLIAS